ncbi:MAG TPA: hypothetical protein VEM76_03680 [Anaeromyxobacteraceae bacterium]|nr:hypothetical protein [Anaeromyxobacteraceae bacterium]
MRRPLFLLALLLLAALGVLVSVRLLRKPPSDEEQIRTLLVDAARAAEEKRIGDAVRDVSERFHGEGLDRREVKQLVAAHVLRGTWVSVTITGTKIDVRGELARAASDVVLSRSGKGTPLAELVPEQASVHRFLLDLAREEGRWKVVGASWRPVTLEEAAAGPELPPSP